MKNIRQGIFETNSSSSHSISISHNTNGLLDTIHPDDNGEIHLCGGEFGWSIETFRDPETKASYAAIDAGYDELKLQMLKEVICEHTGAKDVFFDFTIDVNGPADSYSYIDHQSLGTSEPAFSSKENLKMFIFNPKSYLKTDNDNH